MFGDIQADLIADVVANTSFTANQVTAGVNGGSSLPQMRIQQSAALQPVFIDSHVGLKTTSLTVNIFASSVDALWTLKDEFYGRYHGFQGQLNNNTNALGITVTSVIETVDETDPEIHQAIIPLDITTS